MAEKASLPLSLSPVVVTGGCGFIGSHIVRSLLQSKPNCQIHVIDINTSRNCFADASHTCDVSLPNDVDAVFAEVKPKTIFHVIACPDSIVKQPAVFRRVNVDGARNLLNAFRKIRAVQTFVNTTTSSRDSRQSF